MRDSLSLRAQKRNRDIVLFSLALSVCMMTGCLQQAAAQIPALSPETLSLPGAVNQQMGSPESRQVVPPEPQLAPAPEPEVEKALPQPGMRDDSLTRKFRVSTIEIQGAKHLPTEEADTLVKEYEGRDVSFVELRDLADKLTELYRSAGYVTSIVYIGPQRIEKGHVVLTAAEGVEGIVRFKEGKYFKARAVTSRIDATDDGAFQINDLRRSLRRINENPDLKVRAVLEAGERPEQTDIELELTEEHFPLHVTPFWDSLGRRSIGYQRFGLTTEHNNLFGFGDQAFNSVAFTKGSFSTFTHYDAPIGKHGTRLSFDHSFSTLKVLDRYVPRDNSIRGRAQIFTPSLKQELINTDRLKMSLDLAFDFMDIDTDFNGRRISEDRLRVLRPAINWDSYDPWGRLLIRHEVGIGLDLFNASLNSGSNSRIGTSRGGAGGQFFRYTSNVTRLQRLPWHTYGILRASGQWTPDSLVSAQQFQTGGTFTVRGYREGQFIGDYGYLLSGEWRAPLFLLPKNWTIPKTNYVLRDNIQILSFADYSGVYTRNALPNAQKRDYAMGLGIGTRINLTKHFAGRIDLGFPVIRHRDEPDAQIHFGIETRLF